MTVDDFKRDLSERLGQKVLQLLTRDGEAVEELSDLYQACLLYTSDAADEP